MPLARFTRGPQAHSPLALPSLQTTVLCPGAFAQAVLWASVLLSQNPRGFLPVPSQRDLPEPLAYGSPSPCLILTCVWHSTPCGGAPSPVVGDSSPLWRAWQQLRTRSCECTETRVTRIPKVRGT